MGAPIGGILARVVESVATLALAFAAGASLVCLAPGSGVDERELNSDLGPQAIESLRRARAANRDLAAFLPEYGRRAMRGDLGQSQAFNQPVSTLIAERLPVTAAAVGKGLALAWTLGLVLAITGSVARRRVFAILFSFGAGALACIPVALAALALAIWKLPAFLGIAMAVLPKVYGCAEALLRDRAGHTSVLGARARGLASWRVITAHILLPAARPLLALAAVTVLTGVGSAIPVEALTDQPGMGQLAWRATLARDVPLLVGLTLVITALMLIANLAADLLGGAGGEEKHAAAAVGG